MRVDIDLSVCVRKYDVTNIWVSPYYSNIHHLLFSLFLKFCLFFRFVGRNPGF